MSSSRQRGSCELCGGEQPLTFHHLIPRTCHRNKWFRKQFSRDDMTTRGLWVCRPCHSQIHNIHKEKTLGRCFNTLEKLLADSEIQKYLEWKRPRVERGQLICRSR